MVKKQSKYDVAIIADGNSSIGMGHIMRCGAIADALRDMGLGVLFITSDIDSQKIVADLGFDAMSLNTDYRTLSEQMYPINDCLKSNGIGFAFFDSYFASNSLFENVSTICPVGCFGYGKKFFSGMKLIVPYGISSDRKWYEETFNQKEVTILFGSQYVPLKKSYWKIPKKNKHKEPERLLLTSGGTDPLGITQVLIKEIRTQGIDLAIDVVVGQFYHVDKLKSACDGITSVTFHEGISDLSAIMLEADLAISASGMTLYELMASSVPTVAYAFADNQLGNALLDGGIVWCGDIRKNGKLDGFVIDTIIGECKNIINNPDRRKQLITQGKYMCDGRGAKRIADAINRFIL